MRESHGKLRRAITFEPTHRFLAQVAAGCPACSAHLSRCKLGAKLSNDGIPTAPISETKRLACAVPVGGGCSGSSSGRFVGTGSAAAPSPSTAGKPEERRSVALRGQKQSCWVESGLQIQKRGRTWAMRLNECSRLARARAGGIRAVSCLKRRAIWYAIAEAHALMPAQRGAAWPHRSARILPRRNCHHKRYVQFGGRVHLHLALVACDPSHERRVRGQAAHLV